MGLPVPEKSFEKLGPMLVPRCRTGNNRRPDRNTNKYVTLAAHARRRLKILAEPFEIYKTSLATSDFLSALHTYR